MSGVDLILVIIALIHLVVAFLACTALLSIPKAFLNQRSIYALLSLVVPFFGLLVIHANGHHEPTQLTRTPI